MVGQDWLLNKTLISTQQSLGERATEGTKDSQGLSTQSLVGTYAYMSPEQKQRRQIDERSDIYAVGLMIYRLLTGYANPGEKIRKKDSSLRAFWQRIVDQSVREDPEDRFASAAAMLVELRRGHRVLASLDGKASLQKSDVEIQAKRCYTANRYLDEASMIFPNDPEVLEFRAVMRERLGILQELKTKMQDFRRLKKYDDALAVSEQFCTICIEDEGINKFTAEYPQLVIREQLRQLIEEASRLLDAEEFETASQAAQKALSFDPEDSRAKQIHDQALAMLKKMQMQQTREQVSKGLQKTHSLLRQKRYAKALDTLKHTPCSDSTHPTVIALRNACQSGLKKIRQYWERAEEAHKSADYQGAVSLLNKVLDGVAPEDPGTIERLNQLGSELKELSAASTEMDHAWQNRSYKKCLAAADRILAFQPRHPKAQKCKQACADKIRIIQPHIDKAEEYYQNQQYDKAVVTLEKTKRCYRLERRTAKDDAAVETQHTAYSPEYQEIMDKIATIRKAKASMEQALERARERLEARDLLETRLALNEYFELQTNGKEGLLLQQELESLHRRVTLMRRIRRSVINLAVAAVVGVGLAYGTASLVVTHRMQKALEESCAALTFANLKVTQSEAGSQLYELRQSRLAPLFSIEERWKHWKDSLDRSRLAWEHYARGADEDGQSKFENIPLTEFTPFIRRAFDKFTQEVNESHADANDRLVEGDYDTCVEGCNAFLLNYPEHSHFLDLLQKAKKGWELERSIYDLSVNLTNLSYNLRALSEISPRYREREKLDKQCIKRAESEYDFLDRPLPTDVNNIAKEQDLCYHALEELTLFKQCHGYEGLCEKLTDRVEELEDRREDITNNKDVLARLAEARSLIDQKCWIKAKQMLDHPDLVQTQVSRLKNLVDEKIKQLQELVKNAREQVEQRNWLDAKEAMSGLWSVWNEDDKCDLLTEAQELETKINESMQRESEETRAFAEAIDQKNHDQIEQFVLDRIGRTPNLAPIYVKWFPRLNRDVQGALAQNRINTALNHLSRVLGHEDIKRDANAEELSGLLQNMEGYKALADQISDQTLELTDKARALQNRQCVEALWYVHRALEMNSECDNARTLQTTLQSEERIATQIWRETKLLYDDKCYVSARRVLAPAARDFSGDTRAAALSHDIDAKIEAASQAATNVLNRKSPVKEFYDSYVDYEFKSDLNHRNKKEILKDLKTRIVDPSQEERRSIIIEARRQVLQGEPEYQALASKNSPAIKARPSQTQNSHNPDWCQIKFDQPPRAIDVAIYIEGHGLKALGTAFVRCQDRVYIRVSNSLEPNCSRTQAISLNPWKVHRIKVKSTCFDVKEAEVQVVRKGWLFKEHDLDAMADQITKVYPIDKERARKSLEAAFDRMKEKEDLTTLRVPLIDCWQDEQFMEFEIEE
ncbi:MAG: hypothetical protein ISS70_18290 [Phycisphaerae bacterium]|nr:hypothetical protein [Phycisphaerae bacterium]